MLCVAQPVLRMSADERLWVMAPRRLGSPFPVAAAVPGVGQAARASVGRPIGRDDARKRARRRRRRRPLRQPQPRLHGLFASDGTPKGLARTGPKTPDREVCLGMLARCDRRGPVTVVGDKGYAGRGL